MSTNNSQFNSNFGNYQTPDKTQFISAERGKLTLEVNSPNFADKYSIFRKSAKSGIKEGKPESALSKLSNKELLTEEQSEKITLILELYTGVKLSKDEIQKTLESVKTKAWMSGDETSKLNLNKLFTRFNMVGQTTLTWSAMLSILARAGLESNPVTKAIALVLTSGFYIGSNNFIHNLAKEPLTGTENDKKDQFQSAMLALAAIYGISTGLSVTGGKYFDSVWFSPEQRIENLIVSAANIKEVKDLYQAKVTGNREELRNNAEFNILATSLAEKQAKIAEIKVEIQKLEAQKINAINSETPAQIAAREAQISVKRGSINDSYLNGKGEKIESPLPAEIRSIQNRQTEIENGVNVNSSDNKTNITTRTSLQESKEIVEKLSLLGNNTSQAFTTSPLKGQEMSPYEDNKAMLKLLAKQKGINPEHLDDLVLKKNLSAQEMDLIANDKEKDNGFNNLLVLLMAMPEGALTIGTALKLARNRKILDKDYQRGFERLGQLYYSELSKLKFSDINTGKILPTTNIDPADEGLEISYQEKELIINQIHNSPEFLLAMQIAAAKEFGSLGKEMALFRESFHLQNSAPRTNNNGVGAIVSSVWNKTGGALGNFGTNISQRYTQHQNYRVETNVIKMKSELVSSFKLDLQKSLLSANTNDLLSNLESAVSIIANDSNIEFEVDFVTQEIDPIISIISLYPEISKYNIKKELIHKTLVQLVKHSLKNKGGVYIIDNLIQTISLVPTVITQKELDIISDKINNPKEQIEKDRKTQEVELITAVETCLVEILLLANDSDNILNFDIEDNFISRRINDVIQLIINSKLESSRIIKVLKTNLLDFENLELGNVYSDPTMYISSARELIKFIVKGLKIGELSYLQNNDFFKEIKEVSEIKTKERYKTLSSFLTQNNYDEKAVERLEKAVERNLDEDLWE